MGRHGRLLKTLAVVAAVTFVLHPALCNALHAIEDWDHADETAGSGGQPPGTLTSAEEVPGVSEAHHCGGGHDRPPAVLPPGVPPLDAPHLPSGWTLPAPLAPPELTPSPCWSGPLIPPQRPAQGILRALLCRWLI
jgi:hypothetical protein